MLRAKKGLKVGDHQREAHMLFYLGIVSENKKKYKKSTGYFKRFYSFAKSMQDKVGMAFALNRIGIGFYFLQDYEASTRYNKMCLAIIDAENIYSIYYNLGICLRKFKEFPKSLEFFDHVSSLIFIFRHLFSFIFPFFLSLGIFYLLANLEFLGFEVVQRTRR